MPRPLSPEVWLLVFNHMCFMPLAHRKTIEEIPANFQPALAACSLVCKMFNDLAGTLLYTYPIVHSLPLFIAGIDNPPAIPGSKSKADLLARTQRLFLETRSEPDEKYSVTDEEIAVYAESVENDDDDDDLVARKRELMRMKEAKELLEAWRIILNGEHDLAVLFPRLRTVSVGAISGDQGDWAGRSESPEWLTLFEENTDAIFRFIRWAPAVRHFCQAGAGMFSIEGLLPVAPLDRNLSLTTHSSVYEPGLEPLAIGYRTNWIVHTTDHVRDKSAAIACAQDAERLVGSIIDARRELADEMEDEAIDTGAWSINIGLYVGIADAEDESKREIEKELDRRVAEEETKRISEVLLTGKGGLPERLQISDSFERGVRVVWGQFEAICGMV